MPYIIPALTGTDGIVTHNAIHCESGDIMLVKSNSLLGETLNDIAQSYGLKYQDKFGSEHELVKDLASFLPAEKLAKYIAAPVLIARNDTQGADFSRLIITNPEFIHIVGVNIPCEISPRYDKLLKYFNW